VAFISLGLPDAVLGVAWKLMREGFGRPLESLGWILLGGTSAYLASSFLAGQLMRWLGVGRLLAVSCGLVTVSLAGFAAAPGWAWLIPLAFIGGLGAGAIDSGLNAFAATHFSARVMNWLHACWGIGATSGPLLMTAVLTFNGQWRVGYAILACIVGVLTVLFVLTERQWSQDPSASAAATVPAVNMWAALRVPTVWLQVAVFFVYCGIESSAGQLLFTLMTEGRGMSIGAAGMTVAGYWAALTVGRFAFGQVAASVSAQTVLLVGTVGATLAAGLIWWHPAEWVGVVGAAGLGFGLAPIFPTYMSITPRRVGAAVAAHAVGFQVAAASVGIMVFPWCVTLLVRRWGLEMVSVYLVLASVVMLGLHLLAGRAARR
jgi:fucose permease